MSERIDLDALEQDYATPELPKCRVCDGPMTVAFVQNHADEAVIYCAATIDRLEELGYPEEGEESVHFLNSRAVIPFHADSRILALVRAVRAALDVPRSSHRIDDMTTVTVFVGYPELDAALDPFRPEAT